MPHNSLHHEDFAMYANTRRNALKSLSELKCYLLQLEKVLIAFPSEGKDAGYMDLDNAEQLEGDLREAVELLCDWDSLDREFSRLGL